MAVLLFAFAYLVWPTPWESVTDEDIGLGEHPWIYKAIPDDGLRRSRLTGEVQVLRPWGWESFD